MVRLLKSGWFTLKSMPLIRQICVNWREKKLRSVRSFPKARWQSAGECLQETQTTCKADWCPSGVHVGMGALAGGIADALPPAKGWHAA